jgi:hypothetical protein
MVRQVGQASRPVQRIPGVGPSIAADLHLLGIHDVAELRGRNPETLYADLCREVGHHVDRCVLYVFRCAVYFASEAKPDAELLKWWNWKDRRTGLRACPRANYRTITSPATRAAVAGARRIPFR